MTFPNNIAPNTPPLYRFRLETPLGNVNLNEPPAEWRESGLSVNRDLDKGGIESTYEVNSLTFFGKSADLIKKNKDSDFVNMDITLRVYRLVERDYVEFPTTYLANGLSYKEKKVGGASIAVSLEFRKVSLLEKLDKRASVQIDLTKAKSIGGYEIVDYGDGVMQTLRKRNEMPDIFSFFTITWNGSAGQSFSTPSSIQTLKLDSIDANDFSDETVTTVAGGLSASKANSVLKDLSEEKTFDLTGYISYTANEIADKGGIIFGYTLFDAAGAVYDTVIVDIVNIDSEGTYIFSDTVTILAGHSICFTVNVNNVVLATFTDVQVQLQESVISQSGKNIEGYPIYEATERCLQKCLDVQFPMYSETLQRDDVVYNSAGDTYASSNQLYYASLIPGLSFRGLRINDSNNPLSVNWNDHWKTIQTCFGLGYGIETIGGEPKIRIEDYDYFFDTDISLDLSSRISPYDIETEIDRDRCYVAAETGYNNYDYESINGRGEYNTKQSRTTVLNAEQTFDNIVPLRGDTFGMSKLLGLPITETGTTDEKEDNDTFILKTQQGALPSSWKAETNENITIKDNTSLFSVGSSFNLYFTPVRNLVRNWSRFISGLIGQINSNVSFQVSDKLQTLKTEGEGYTVTENDDLQVNTYGTPKYKAVRHTVTDIEFTWDDLQTFLASPYKQIRLSSTVTGWVVNLYKPNDKDVATITIQERYV